MLASEKFDIFLRKGRERMSPRSYGMTQLTFLKILVLHVVTSVVKVNIIQV